MKKSRALVRRRAATYWENQKKTMLRGDANRAFFKNIKSYKSREKPSNFDVRTLFESSLADREVAEKLADHFNGISSEFNGLDPADIPVTYSCPISPLQSGSTGSGPAQRAGVASAAAPKPQTSGASSGPTHRQKVAARTKWNNCFICKQWGKHRANECRLSQDKISALTPQDPEKQPSGEPKDSQFDLPKN